MTYKQIQHELNIGKKAYRKEWVNAKRFIRQNKNDNPDNPQTGELTEDCDGTVVGPGTIVIYQPTQEDMKANDWITM